LRELARDNAGELSVISLIRARPELTSGKDAPLH
jgi:hypothetical protein